MVGYAITILADADEAEDIAQSTFLRLWKSEMHFENDKALKSYLFKSIRNRSLNILKHIKVKQAYQLKENHTSEFDTDSIENAILKQESAALLNKAIKRLDPRKKQVLELSLRGVSNEIIATRLGITIATVKSMKWKAYKILRSQLAK